MNINVFSADDARSARVSVFGPLLARGHYSGRRPAVKRPASPRPGRLTLSICAEPTFAFCGAGYGALTTGGSFQLPSRIEGVFTFRPIEAHGEIEAALACRRGHVSQDRRQLFLMERFCQEDAAQAACPFNDFVLDVGRKDDERCFG